MVQVQLSEEIKQFLLTTGTTVITEKTLYVRPDLNWFKILNDDVFVLNKTELPPQVREMNKELIYLQIKDL